MAFRKKADTETDVFILTLPLHPNGMQYTLLEKLFRAGLEIHHQLMSRKLKALDQMERRSEWRTVQTALRAVYADKNLKDGDRRDVLNPLHERRNDLCKRYGLTERQFESDAKRIKVYSGIVNSQTIQRIAAQVWDSFEAYLYGKGEEIRFMPWKKFTSLYGKQNSTGIRYKDGCLIVGKEHIRVRFSKHDPYGYEAECMKRRIHYSGIIRRWYPSGWRYFAQLCLGGKPPIKAKPNTGELLHPPGAGRVGLDIGPQTLAAVGDTNARLFVLAENIEDIHRELRRLQRKRDRSIRTHNPEMFDAKGRIVPINRLPKHCAVLRNGVRYRKWVKTKNCLRLEARIRYLHRSLAQNRRLSHNGLANKLLVYGSDFFIEKMNWRGLAKRRKEDKRNNNGKHISKKRFGKSIANKAPASFVKILQSKVEALGGTFQEIDTAKAKASQYNHMDHAYKKKKLSQRWNHLPNGDTVQRDLYSAFLIQSTNDTLDGFVQQDLDAKYPAFKILHDAEIERLSFIHTPSSTGVRCAG